LDHPAKAQETYPYTGMYQFVPLLKSKEWPVDKIYKLARLHVNLIESLRPMYVNNLQDINHVIDEDGNSLMQGFYGMQVSNPQRHKTGGLVPASQLIQSVHNTSRNNKKVFLTQASKFEEAVDQFSNLHNILKNNIKHQFHANVFIPGTIPGLVGKRQIQYPVVTTLLTHLHY
jgi:hypothetical protein